METQEISKKNREFYNRPWFWIIVGVVVLVAIGSSNNSGSGNAGSNAQDSAPVTAASVPEQKAAAPAPVPAVKAAPVKSSTPSQPTYTTPSGATVNNSGTVVTPPPAPPASWHTVQTFSGSGASNTDLFTIRGVKWQVQWTATADNNNGDTFCANYSSCSFDVFIYKPGGDYAEDHIEVPVNTTKNGTSYFYTTGQFYLKVDPYKIGNWTLTIQDYY